MSKNPTWFLVIFRKLDSGLRCSFHWDSHQNDCVSPKSGIAEGLRWWPEINFILGKKTFHMFVSKTLHNYRKFKTAVAFWYAMAETKIQNKLSFINAVNFHKGKLTLSDTQIPGKHCFSDLHLGSLRSGIGSDQNSLDARRDVELSISWNSRDQK